MGGVTIPNAALLDPAPLTAERFAATERAMGALLGTTGDVVLVQAEAIVPLEAVARGVGATGATCLNVVTGPYGAHFGQWLAEAGGQVRDLEIPFERAVTVDEIAAALQQRPATTVLSVVHAEVATGSANPLEEIAALARERGLLTIVDAVASVGGHDLAVDDLGLDFCVVGPQKALAGPAGISAVTVSARGWEVLASADRPWRGSALSLLDWKDGWIDAGRAAIPGTPSVLEVLALEAACARLAEEGIDRVIARHRRMAAATRAGVRAMGLAPFVDDDAGASALATTVRLPDGVDGGRVVEAAARYGVRLLRGAGGLRERLVRVDHMGVGARPDVVLASVAALGAAVQDAGGAADVGAGTAAAAERLRAPR
jgi:aspartate aminotransferase-like enzyme